MAGADSSFLGLAKQTALGAANTTDADFKYLLFNEGAVSPNSVIIPLDPEVGGGAMQRDVKKVGVTSGGGLQFIPRPDTLGLMLLGAFGNVDTDLVLARQSLNGSTVTAGLKNPVAPNTLWIQASGSATGNVVIVGTKADDTAETDTIALNGTTLVTGTKTFKTVTSVQVPTVSSRTVNVGFTVATGGAHRHRFYMGSNQFSAPYYTVRSSPGGMWGEQFKDMRVSALGMSFAGANFLRGTIGFQGGLPSKLTTAAWGAISKVDGGPQFLCSNPDSAITIEGSTTLKVLSGQFGAGMSIPLDEQWIVGSYSPDAFDIVNRAFSIDLGVKIADESLYTRVMYDPAASANWLPDVLKDGRVNLNFVSDVEISTGVPYSLTIEGNGATGDNGNIVWTSQPISLRAGRQVVMALRGSFLADPSGSLEPVVATLINKTASY